jgi:hypothetical protein
MEYIEKTCPICGSKFIILQKVEQKAVYCKLECLSAAQGRTKRGKVSSFISA